MTACISPPILDGATLTTNEERFEPPSLGEMSLNSIVHNTLPLLYVSMHVEYSVSFYIFMQLFITRAPNLIVRIAAIGM